MKRFCFSALAALTIAGAVNAQDYHVTINKESGIYQKGEKAVVTMHADKALTDSLTLRISENNHVVSETRILPKTTDFQVYAKAYFTCP